MSAQWMGYFFDNTELKGSKLLLALAIADHADMLGRARPGISLLSQKIRCSERQTKSLMSELESEGYVVKVRAGSGRGHLTELQLIKVIPSSPFTADEKVSQSSPFVDAKGCNPASERVKSSVPALKREPFEPERVERAASAGRSRRKSSPDTATDPRKDHPAIAAIRAVAEIYPPKPIWDRLITVLGPDIDGARLQHCFVEWAARGYKPTNYAWALEWYATGIPTTASSNGNGHRKTFDPGRPVATRAV